MDMSDIVLAADMAIDTLVVDGKVGSKKIESLTIIDGERAPFNKALVGLQVTEYRQFRRKLVVSEERPTFTADRISVTIYTLLNQSL